MSDRIFLHICCAPCLTVVQPSLESEGWGLTGYFYNPNIHPWREWERRLSTLRDYAPAAGIEVVFAEDYPLEDNLSGLLASSPRCLSCYDQRLGATAKKASEMGFTHFSTTLMLSPYQDADLLRKAGEKAAGEHSVEFVYYDLRSRYHESISRSRSAGLYRQPYCGCVFSERDRYAHGGGAAGRHLSRGRELR